MTRKTILIAIILLLAFTSLAFAQNNFPVKEGVYLRDSSRFFPGKLTITNVTADSFDFKINALFGARMDGASGTAIFNGDTAIYDDGKVNLIHFKLEKDAVHVDATPRQEGSRYIRATLIGIYRNKEVFTPDYDKEIKDLYSELFTDKQKSIFINLVGDKYHHFTSTAQYHTHEYEKNLDDYTARVYAFHVESVWVFTTSIIMVRDSDDTIWCAIRSVNPSGLLYFTTADNKHDIPKTILHWCNRKIFEDLPIIYMPDDKDSK